MLYPAAGSKFYVFLKNLHFVAVARRRRSETFSALQKQTGQGLFAKLGIYNQKITKLKSEYFLFVSKSAWYSTGVMVPFTPSLSVYAKVLAHNLNDIRN